MKQNKSKVLKIKDYIENEIISIKDQESDLNTKENKDLLNFKLQQLESNIDQNNNNWDVNSQQDITSHRKIIGKFIVFSKKIIRKLLSWYINPIVGQQKSFNGSVTRTLNELYKFTKGIIPNINSNYNEINMLKGQINCLTQSIEEIRSRENKFRSEIDQTKIEINDLKEGINDLELEIVNSREKIYEVEAEINNMEERVYERIENLTKKSNDRENTIKEIINEIEMKVNSSKEEVYERIENLAKKSNDRENTIKEIINEIEMKVNSSKEEVYERIENLAKKADDRENTIKEIINEIEMKVNSSKEEVYERIENLAKKADDRENTIKEIINEIEIKVNSSKEEVYERIENLAKKSNDRENTIKEIINEIEIKVNSSKEEVYERIEDLAKKSNDRENTIKEIINEIEMKVDSSKEEVYERIEDLAKKSNDRENTIKEIINEIEIKVNSSKEEIYERIENLAKKSNDRENTIKEIEKNITNINNETQDKSEAIDFDYLEFENKFRGSEELIKNRMKKYFNYFREKSNVLDIGCGRGEFLELLQKGNVNSKGIDINKQMVEHCQNKGLDVVRSDAIEYLEQVEDGSLDGVFMGQVVEHLDLNYLLKVIELIDKKLTENGIFIAETPNPQSIYIYANAFYIDPTHVKPVHPATLKYLIERYSLEVMEVQGASAIPEENKLLTIHDEYLKNDNLEKLNSNWDKLNNLLFNYRDYAIVAKKIEVV